MRDDLRDLPTPGRRPRSYIPFEAGVYQVAQPHSSKMGEGNCRDSQNKNHNVWRSQMRAVLSGLKSLELRLTLLFSLRSFVAALSPRRTLRGGL